MKLAKGLEKLEMIDINSIKHDPQNAKIHTAKQIQQLARIIETEGFTDPIVIGYLKDNKEDSYCVSGNGRLLALKELSKEQEGYDKIPVSYLQFNNESQRNAFALKHNAINMETGFDKEITEQLLKQIEKEDRLEFENLEELELQSIDVKVIEATRKAIEMLELDSDIQEAKKLESTEDDVLDQIYDKTSEVAKYINFGDIVLLGNHRLMCGDSFSKDCIDLLIGNNKIDCVYTDPPYGMNLDTNFSAIGNATNKKRIQEGKEFIRITGKKYKKVERDDKSFDPTFLLEYFQSVKEIFLWGANYFADKLPNLSLGKSSWFVWNKRVEDGKCDLSDIDFTLSEFELCWSKTKHRQRIINAVWFGYNGLQFEGMETLISKGSIKRIHPNQKPVRMITKCFEYFLKEEHKNIVDLFGGSGSILIACEETNRNCFTMEYDPQYCEDIINRYIRYKQNNGEDVFLIKDGEKTAYHDFIKNEK